MRKISFLFIVSVLAVTISAPGFLLGQEEEEAEDLSQIQAKTVQSFVYCYMHRGGTLASIADAITRLMQILTDQDVAPSGPALAVFPSSPDTGKHDDFDWDIGFPITPEVIIQPPLQVTEWTHTRVVEAYHLGPWDTIQKTYAKIFEWMKDKGYVPYGPIMEMYFIGPDVANPPDYRTRIWIPYRK